MKKTENKVTQAFAELMIEKIKQFQGNWKKPWVSPGFTGMPQNINGRHYNGINSLMLMFHREKKGYRTPIFMTFHQAKAAGWEVKKGETGFPVELWRQVYKDENGKKLTFEEFNNLSEDEQKRCTSYPIGMTYIVFNVEQTRMPELAPDKFQKLVDAYAPGAKLKDGEGMMRSPELDFMLKNNKWLCPIEQLEGDQAYYSISKDSIVVPLKTQFDEGELFYSTLLHEMAHSTGAKERLDRLIPSTRFGSTEYAREELVAEMTAAMTASQLGITKQVKEDSIAYLKSWLKSLQEEPEFIRTVMGDVNKACNMIQTTVMSEEMAEAIKQEAIEGIDKFLENKKMEEQQHKAPLLDREEFEKLTPSLKANEINKLSLPEVPQEILDMNDKVKQKVKDCTAWVIKDNTIHLIGDDAQRVGKALKLHTEQGVNPQGETIDTLSFDLDKLDSYLPQVVRKGIRVSIQEVKPLVKEQTVQQQPQPSGLHMAHLGNGISVWEEGDNEYTAYISPDRKISLYKDFSPENLQRIQQMAEKGNMIIGNKDSEGLALKPLNPAERFIYQPYGADPILLSREQVGDRMVVCHGQSIVKGKDGEELDFNNYPRIEYPQQFIVSVTGMDNIRNALSYMTRMGIDYSHLNNEMFFDALAVAEEALNPTQKDFKQIAFHIVNRGTAENPDRAIVAFSNLPEKLDEERQLPRYYMRNNAMLYNKPAQREIDAGLPMDRLVLSQPNYVRVNGRDNLLDTMNALKQHGVSFTADVEKQLVETFEQGQVMPRAVATRDRIYLGINHGIANEVNMNVSEYSIDEVPLLEISRGVIQKASLYDRDVQNAYLVATFDEDGKIDSYVKVLASPDALHQAQKHLEHRLDNPDSEKSVDVRLIEVDKDFKDSVEYRMAGKDELQKMLDENTQNAFCLKSLFPIIRTKEEEEFPFININPLNNTTMAKKSMAEEAQVQEPEVKKQENEKQETQQTASEEQQAKKELREGAHVFQAKDKEGKLIPGIYRVMVVKDGAKSEVATISKEDRDQYFADVKGKAGEEAEVVRKALAEKYITPEGKRIEAPKAENAEKQQAKEAEKPFIIRHTSEEKAQRITEPKLYKRTDNGLYAIRCKIDGEQQMSRTFDTANKDPKIADFNKKLIDAFFSGYKGLDADKQLQRRIDVAAIKFNDVLTAEKQELSKGMSR